MSLDFDYPLFLKPEELDALLERGWFRMRDTVFTTHYYLRDGLLLSTVWLRSDLQNYQFTKSQRRKLRQLHQKYSITFAPLKLTAEHEDLYKKYLTIAKGDRSDTIKNILEDVDGLIFTSIMQEIRDPEQENRLIAFSIFDIGRESLESIVGIYDPKYSDDSLGVFTMFLEVEYAIQAGYRWYYIGYFTPGFDAFDYKLRLGHLSFYDPDQKQWFQMQDFSIASLWSTIHIQKLMELCDFLKEKGIQSRIMLNQHYDTIVLNGLGDRYLDEPIFLDLRIRNHSIGQLCYYSMKNREFELVLADYEARKLMAHNPQQKYPNGWPIHSALIRKIHFLTVSSDIEALFLDIFGG